MAKKNNLKDNTFETGLNIDEVNSAIAEVEFSVDENQIDLEDQIKDEIKLPQFKKVKGKDVSHLISGSSMVINNSNLTTKLKKILIDKGICSDKDFK